MALQLLQVDAFTNKPFGGNPAAVCFLEQPADEEWMQHAAAEMNLSETAFLVPEDDDSYGLRWFTPATEVDLCGHATLASAHALWETGRLAPESDARFRTKSGLLVCRRSGDAIEMDFPSTPVREAPPPKGLVEALGAEPAFVGVSRFDVFCELDSEQTVRALAPDHRGLKDVGVRGVIVTAASSGDPYDFVSRFLRRLRHRRRPGHRVRSLRASALLGREAGQDGDAWLPGLSTGRGSGHALFRDPRHAGRPRRHHTQRRAAGLTRSRS
ncbi:MAG: PhzF family phenazine biosynthesis protein [Bryobacterales bacterium]